MKKTVYVKAYAKQEGKVTARDAYAGNADESPQEDRSSLVIDDFRLATDLGKAVMQLNLDGYEVFSISEITSGNCTDGILVVAQKKQDQ